MLYTEKKALSFPLFPSSVATVITLGFDPDFSVRKDSMPSVGASATLHHIVIGTCPQVKAAKNAY